MEHTSTVEDMTQEFKDLIKCIASYFTIAFCNKYEEIIQIAIKDLRKQGRLTEKSGQYVAGAVSVLLSLVPVPGLSQVAKKFVKETGSFIYDKFNQKDVELLAFYAETSSNSVKQIQTLLRAGAKFCLAYQEGFKRAINSEGNRRIICKDAVNRVLKFALKTLKEQEPLNKLELTEEIILKGIVDGESKRRRWTSGDSAIRFQNNQKQNTAEFLAGEALPTDSSEPVENLGDSIDNLEDSVRQPFEWENETETNKVWWNKYNKLIDEIVRNSISDGSISYNNNSVRRLDSTEFTQTYSDFVLRVRAQILSGKINPKTSASQETNKNFDIFLQPFLSYPVVLYLDKQAGVELYIDPKHWAEAFMKTEIKAIATILTRAVFTPEDIGLRKEFPGNCSHTIVKELAITQAAKWMMNKGQDPWSYRFEEARWPKTEEFPDIEKAFEEVTEDNNLFEPFDCGIDFEPRISDFEKTSDDKMENVFEEMVKVSSTDESGLDLNKLFRGFVKLGVLGNPAQTARELTYILFKTVGECIEHVFVDAAPFSTNRWTGAFRKALAKSESTSNIVPIASRLFDTYLNRNSNKEVKFDSIEKTCPIWRLAVIRGAMWLKENSVNSLLEINSFDSAIPEHNVGFTDEDIPYFETVFRKCCL